MARFHLAAQEDYRMLICPLREECNNKYGCFHGTPHDIQRACGNCGHCATMGQFIECVEFHKFKHSDVFDVISID